MMRYKKIALFIALIACSSLLFSQKNSFDWIDKKIDSKNDSISSNINAVSNFINSSFVNESDKSRAIFYWVTKNINYDTDNLYSFSYRTMGPSLTEKTFSSKKGLCIGYASLFDTLCKLSHIQSYIVKGATKQKNTQSLIAHAWCVALINNSWQLFDPTWAAGYVSNNKFIRKLNNKYFSISPLSIAETHLPFDPIWQLRNFPISQKDFYTSKSNNNNEKTTWNFNDSIKTYLNSSKVDQTIAELRRLKQCGTESEASFTYALTLENEIKIYHFGKYNKAVRDYNYVTTLFNEYINFKNKQFSPKKSDDEIAQIIPEIEKERQKISNSINGLPETYDDLNENISTFKKHFQELDPRIQEEKAFIATYLKTKPNKRKDLFYKKTYSIYGIPINK